MTITPQILAFLQGFYGPSWRLRIATAWNVPVAAVEEWAAGNGSFSSHVIEGALDEALMRASEITRLVDAVRQPAERRAANG